jgi:hypothetical protein
MSRGRYVYCIIESKREENFGSIGIGKSEVYTVHYKDIAAVVSNSLDTTYEVLEEGLTHQRVIEEVMRRFTVIPMGFGQVSKSEEEVKAFMREHYGILRALLRKLNGKVELGVKVLWKMDSIIREIVASSDRIRVLNRVIQSKSANEIYPLKIELGKLVAEAIAKKGEVISSDIYRSLEPLSVESKKNPVIGDQMILNAAFLVEKNKEKEFDEKMNELEAKYGEMVTLKYIVSPPYNFASLGG